MFGIGCTKPDNQNENEIVEITSPEGALSHAFSVSPTKKVYFAKGNLQYRASTNTWRFAENQWDTIGSANLNRSATYDGWIDLFCYGSSGYNGAVPYGFYDSQIYGVCCQMDIAETNYDWGECNPISNAGNETGLWRTMTYEEWRYLLFGRAWIGNPFGLGTLSLSDNTEIVGAFIYPDDGDFSIDDYYHNSIRMSETELEQSGVVFLPYLGRIERYFDNPPYYRNTGHCDYLSGSSRKLYEVSENPAPIMMEFTENYLWPLEMLGRAYGGVRLVCNCN